MAKKIKVVGYIRTSTVSKDLTKTDGSLQNQKDHIESAIKEENRKARRNSNPEYKLLQYYEDKGKSGAILEERKAFLQMLDDAEAKQFDYIFVRSMTRFSRSTPDLHVSLERLDKIGVKVFFDKDNVNTGSGSTGRLLINVLAAIADFEREVILERTDRGRKRVWRDETKTIGALAWPYERNESGNIIVNEENKKAFDYVVDLYLNQGFAFTAIAEKLNAEGVRSPARTGYGWNVAQLSFLFSRDFYCTGVAVQNKFKRETVNGKYVNLYEEVNGKKQKVLKPETDWITIKVPKLVTASVWDKIQKRKKSNRKKPKKYHTDIPYDTFLAENILECGVCGRRVKKRIRFDRPNHQYCCSRLRISKRQAALKSMKPCKSNFYPSTTIDELAFDYIVDVLTAPETFIKDFLSNPDKVGLEKKIKGLNSQLDALNQEIDRRIEQNSRIKDNARRRRHQAITEEKESKCLSLQGNLEDAEMEIKAKDQINKWEDYKRELNKLVGAKRMLKKVSMKWRLQGKLNELPFIEKKRILEAIVNGAFVKVHPPSFTETKKGGSVIREYLSEEDDSVQLDFENVKFDISRLRSIIRSIN